MQSGRRDFLTTLCGAVAWPIAARAQQPRERMRRIGVLGGLAQEDPEAAARIATLRAFPAHVDV